MSTINRALGAGMVVASLFLGFILRYFLRRPSLTLLAVILAAAGAILFKRLSSRTAGFAVAGTVIGAIVGLGAATTAFPYRETAAAWGLTPETFSAQIVFGALDVLASCIGAFLGSFVTIPRADSTWI